MQLHAELKLRKVHPDKFPPALFETLGEYLAKVCDIRRKRRTRADGGDHQEAKFHSDDIDIEENRRSLERGKSKLVRNIQNFFSNNGLPRSLGVVKWIHYVHKIGVRTTDRDRDQLSLEELTLKLQEAMPSFISQSNSQLIFTDMSMSRTSYVSCL